MIQTILGIAAKELNSIGIPYEFMRWTDPDVPDPYWIGEYTETATLTEDGYEEGTLLVTGTTQGSWLKMLQDTQTIKDHFSPIYGLRTTTDWGTVVIFYDTCFPVDTGQANLKRMQVNLQIKAWKGTE